MQYFHSLPEPSENAAFARLFFEGTYSIGGKEVGEFLVELAQSDSVRRADYCDSFIGQFRDAVQALPAAERQRYFSKFNESVTKSLPELIAADQEFCCGVVISLARAFEGSGAFDAAASIYSSLARTLLQESKSESAANREELHTNAAVIASLALRAAYYDSNYELVDRIHDSVLRAEIELDSFKPEFVVYLRQANTLKALSSNDFDSALRSSRENLFSYQELGEKALPELELELRLLFAKCLHRAGETAFAISRYREAVSFSFERFGEDSEQSYRAHVELYNFHDSISDKIFAAGVANRLYERSQRLFHAAHPEQKQAWSRMVKSLIEQDEVEKANIELLQAGELSLLGAQDYAREVQALHAQLDMNAERYDRAEKRILSILPVGVTERSDHWEDWQRPYIAQLIQCRARSGRYDQAIKLASAMRDHYAVQGLRPDGDYFDAATFAAEAADRRSGGVSGWKLVDETLELDRRANREFPLHQVRLLIKAGELRRRGSHPDYDKAMMSFNRAQRIISELNLDHCPEYRRVLGHLIELSSAVGNQEDFRRFNEKLELVELLSPEE